MHRILHTSLTTMKVHFHLVSYNMLVLDTFIMIPFVSWKRLVFLVFLLLLGIWSNVTVVSFKNIANNCFMILFQEHVEILDCCILIFVALFPFHILMEIYLSWILFMITPRCFQCTCRKINLKIFKLLNIFVYGSKMNINIILSPFILVMKENIHPMHFKTIFTNMGSSIKPWYNTILNIMVYLKEWTRLS